MKKSADHIIDETVLYPPESQLRFLRRRERTFDFNWHNHEEYELTLITHGSGRRYIGDSLVKYQAGDLVLVPPMVPHTWQSEGEGDHQALVLQFKSDFLGEGFFDSADMIPLRPLLNHGQAWDFGSDETVEVLLSQIEQQKGILRIVRFFELLQHLTTLDRQVLDSTAIGSSSPRNRSIMNRVLKEIIEASGRQIYVRELADVANMSESHFRRFFKKNTGRTVIDFINETRLARASEMLISSDLPVTLVASDCGFANLAWFNRKFKESKGCTPRDFRKTYR